MLKKLVKKNKNLYKFLSDSREVLRIIYNTKTRSRFLWNLRSGDNKLSLDYPLNKDSVVFDIGAYEGNFTKKIYNKFHCNVYAFEPLNKQAKSLRAFFKEHPKVKIYNFGLLDSDRTVKLSSIEAASSIFSRPEGELDINVDMKSFINFANNNAVRKIDLLYMNIEGSEYELMNHIIESGFINKIRFIQIQFHNFVDNAKPLRNEIRKKLKKTHMCSFNYPFIWERWDKIT